MESTNTDLVQDLQHDMTQTVLPVTVYVGLEMILGLFGNILVIYVFSCRYHACNFRYFVLCMAILDLTSCLIIMPGEMLTELRCYTFEWLYLCKVKTYVNLVAVNGIALSLLLIAIDRYRKVCQPLGWQIKRKVAIWLCLAVYGVTFITSVPAFILSGVETEEVVYKNKTIIISKCEVDEAFRDTPHPGTYTIVMSIVLSILLVCMFVLYVFIARKLYRDSRTYFCTITQEETTKEETTKKATLEIYVAWSEDSRIPDTSVTGHADGGKENPGFEMEMDADNVTDDTMPACDSNKHIGGNGKLGQNKFQRQKTERRPGKAQDIREMAAGARRKTLIMLVLTIVFIVTTTLYLTIIYFVTKRRLTTLNNSGKAAAFFFVRLYFINHVINPLVYGIMDPHFRQIIKASFKRHQAS